MKHQSRSRPKESLRPITLLSTAIAVSTALGCSADAKCKTGEDSCDHADIGGAAGDSAGGQSGAATSDAGGSGSDAGGSGGDAGTPATGAGGAGGSQDTAGDAGSGGSHEPPAPLASDLLCGTRPGGDYWRTHVIRLETDRGDAVQLERTYEEAGVGESAIFRLDAMSLRINGEEICIGDELALGYENTHHNWDDVARGTARGTTYELRMQYANPDNHEILGTDTLSAFDEDGNAVLEEVPLTWTGTPPFCYNCMRSLGIGIEEIVADNVSVLTDEAGEHEALIEIHSSGARNLAGWSLSNDFSNRRKWTFGEVSVSSGGRLVVFADGDVDQGPLHTSFKLSPSGGELILTAPDGRTDGGFVYGPQAEDESLVYSSSASAYVRSGTPTPGEPSSE